jgi:hypothetical protein
VPGPEANLWKWLRGGKLPRGHFSRIESEPAPGFPDINYCINGCEGNIELKVSRHPKAKFPFKRWGLGPNQIRWMEDRLDVEGLVFIFAQVGDRVYILRPTGSQSEVLRLNSLTLAQIQERAIHKFSRRNPDLKHLHYHITHCLTDISQHEPPY